jgi:hypothetical protein
VSSRTHKETLPQKNQQQQQQQKEKFIISWFLAAI